MSRITHLGWGRYKNTGNPYRHWRFEEDVPEVGGAKGRFLHDRGPERSLRFVVVDSGFKVVEKPSEDDVRELLHGGVPPWEPPREDVEELIEAAGRIEQALARAGRRSAGGGTATASSAGKAPQEGPENEHLRLKNQGEYSNTLEGFRTWELKHDCPEVQVFHVHGLDGQPFAQEGDELWEAMDGDDLTPFKLKRDGKRIANPEWWQVRHLFGGLRDDAATDPRRGRGPHVAHQYFHPERESGARFEPHEYRTGAYLFRRDVEEIGASAGDVLIYAYNQDQRPKAFYGRVRELGIEDYGKLRDALGGIDGLPDSIPATFQGLFGERDELRCAGYERGRESCALWRFLKDGKKWGGRLKNFHSRLILLKPWRRSVSEPIVARSPEGAIFSLMHDLGYAPPRKLEGSDA